MMEEEFPESSLKEVIQDSLQDLELGRVLQDQHSPETLKQGQEQQSLHSGLDHVPVDDKEGIQDEEGHHKRPPDPPQDQLEVQEVDQDPTDDGDRGGPSRDGSDLSQVDRDRSFQVLDQDLLQAEQSQDLVQRVGLDRGEQDLSHVLIFYFHCFLNACCARIRALTVQR